MSELRMSWLTFRESLWKLIEKEESVLGELQQADLITSEECKRLQVECYDISDVIDVQKGKSPEVMYQTAEVLRRHGFDEESKLLPVLGELQQADLITSEECKRLRYDWETYDMSNVVDVQKGKSPEVMFKTAEVLRRHGFEKESNPLAVLAELQQADVITSEECEGLSDFSDVVNVLKGKSPEVMLKTAEVLRRHGLEKESNFLAVLAELQQANLITSEECKMLPPSDLLFLRHVPQELSDMSDVVRVQKGKSPEVMYKTAEVLRRHEFEKESKLLAVLAELQQADVITSEECEGLSDISGVVGVQSGKSPEVVSKTAEVLRRHGLEKESKLLAVLAELQQANLITSEECKMQPPSGLFFSRYVRQELSDMSDVVVVQSGKSPEVMSKTAEVLRRHGLEKESKLLAANAFLNELQQADLITSEEWEELSDINDVVAVQSGKSTAVMTKTADVLRRLGFEKESRLLSGEAVKAVLAELQQADLISHEECKRLQVQYDISGVVRVQSGKSPEVLIKTAEVLRRHGFEGESRFLAVLADLRQADLTASESKRLSDIRDVVRLQSGKSPEVMSKRRHGFEKESRLLAVLTDLRQSDLTASESKRLSDISGVVRLQSGKSPEVMSITADVLQIHGFEKESRLLAALADPQHADLITKEECEQLILMDVFQNLQSPEVIFRMTDVLRRHGFKKEYKTLAGRLLRCADEAELFHLVDEEWSKLFAAYHRLQDSLDAVVERLPEQSTPLFHRAYDAVSLPARRLCSERPKASKILYARDLRRRIEALRDPKLLQQLSSYEENNLKPFIVNFLDQCRRKGVQPDSSQPDVCLSPSTPAGQVLGFILSRKDYYITDLHIDREYFSPWDVDTPPPARVPLILNGPDHHRSLNGLCKFYSTLFTKVVENVETLPRQQYLNLKSYFQYQPHTEVHLPMSQEDVRDRLHHTPLFAPLCTALLREVVWFLFTHDANDLSNELGDYEKKLASFVSQFLLACHVDGVVPPTGGMALHEDACDLSDPTHLFTCVLALKPYYVGSLHVDESLFTALEREGSHEGEGGREKNVSMDASPFEPTPPTKESESPGSPQSKGKGKHRVETSPSAVPAKRSAQGEGREDEEKEEEEEEAAGSSAKRMRREENHMTGASQSGTGSGTDSGGNTIILSQKVYDHPGYRELFRTHVSTKAAGKERALLEGLGLDEATIEAQFRNNPRDVEEAVHCGLLKWSEGHRGKQPTWEVLLWAMEHAQIANQHIQGLETELSLK